MLTRRDLLAPSATGELRSLVRRPPVVVFTDSSLRQALDQMLAAGVGRLVVVERAAPRRPVGILTRSDLLGAHGPRRRADAGRPASLLVVPASTRLAAASD